LLELFILLEQGDQLLDAWMERVRGGDIGDGFVADLPGIEIVKARWQFIE
jgi:hypothetical protein